MRGRWFSLAVWVAVAVYGCASTPDETSQSTVDPDEVDRWVVSRTGIRHGGEEVVELDRGRLSSELRTDHGARWRRLERLFTEQRHPGSDRATGRTAESQTDERGGIVHVAIREPSVAYGLVGTLVRAARRTGADRVRLELPGVETVSARPSQPGEFWRGSQSKWILRISIARTSVRVGPDIQKADPDPDPVDWEWEAGNVTGPMVDALRQPSLTSDRREHMLVEFLRTFPWRRIASVAHRLREARDTYDVAVANYARIGMPRNYPVAALQRALRATCEGYRDDRFARTWKLSAPRGCEPMVGSVRLANLPEMGS